MESSADPQHQRDVMPFGYRSRVSGLFSFVNEPSTVQSRPSIFETLPWRLDSLFSRPSPWNSTCTTSVFGRTFNYPPPATTWPFLSEPLIPTVNVSTTSDATAALAAEMEAELTRCHRMEFEAWRIQRELEFSRHVSKVHECEWLQDDAKAEELEDALYEGKQRPSHKRARRVLMDTIQQQELTRNDLESSNRSLQDVIKHRDMELALYSKMEQELKEQREQVWALERILRTNEEEQEEYQEKMECLSQTVVEKNDLIKTLREHVTQREKIGELDAKLLSDRKERLNVVQNLLERAVEALELNQQALCQKTLAVEKIEKAREKAEKTVQARDRSIVELNERIAAHEKKYDELERDIKDRIRDVRVREDTVKAKEHELNSHSRGAKEATKETGKELKTVRTQLKAAENKATELEKKIRAAADEYQILKLDFETTVSGLEALRAATANPKQKPDQRTQEQFHKLAEERDKFRGLYETARTNEPIIQDRIARAVRLAKAETTTSLNSQFEAWKHKTKQVTLSADAKLQEAEARAEVLEQKVGETCVAAEARVSEILKDTDERIQDLSRAKLGLVAKVGAKDAEISWLKQRLAALGSVV